MEPLNSPQSIWLARGVALGTFLLRLLRALLAEFRRANAAAQRYEDLRYRSGWHGRIAPDDIRRRIFEEFYSFGEAVESRRPGGAGWMFSAFAGARGVVRRMLMRIASHPPRRA